MKSLYADLVDNVVSSYDQTKTTIQGRITSKTINSQTVLGPTLNKFIDVVTDTTLTPAAIYATENERLFVMNAPASGVASLALYTFDFDTASYAYVGRITFNLPNSAATTHTIRALKIIDTGTTGWKVYIATVGSVVINGGLFLINKVDLADFVPIGFPNFPLATTSDAKAVYDLQDPAFLGAAHTAANTKHVAAAGVVLDKANNRLYLHNGVAATHQYHVFDTSATPTITSYSGITGVAATDVISQAGHPFINGDQFLFTSLTGGAGLTTNTVYFVVNSVAGVSYQLSTTSGGAAVNFTTDISSATGVRAFGITGSHYLHSTGNLPALTGTLLLTDSEDYASPASVNVSVDGFPCAFFGTSSNMYLGRLSELTVGAVTWPSVQTCNLLGTVNQITAPSATYMAWSNVLNRALYTTATSVFVIKQFINNSIESIFGGANNRYLEAVVGNNVVEFQTLAFNALDLESGYLFVSGSTTGQRGVYTIDLRSDQSYDYSYIVTKVLDTPSSVYKYITTLDQLFEYTGSLYVYYRNSGFGSISGGWTLIPFAEDLSGYSTGAQVQFKICFDTLGLDTSIHAQLHEFVLGFESNTENSENWEFNFDDTDSGNPSRVSFRLKKAYASSVPILYFRAYDLSDVLVANHNTSANAGFFQYSTDSGANWNSLGTIPNTVGTLIRYTFSTPPGVEVRPVIKES